MKKAKQGAVPVPKKNLWKQIAKHFEEDKKRGEAEDEKER